MTASGAAHRPPTTENCRFCWMCRHVCPVGLVTARETLTPHAWALTIESVRRGQLRWDRGTADVMYACADCGLCQAHCITDQPLPDAIVAAREAIVEAGVAPGGVAARARSPRSSAAAFPRVDGGALVFAGEAVADGDPGLRAAAALLSAAGMPAVVAGHGRATGRVESTLGLRDLGADLARSVVADVVASGATEVFVVSPADYWTFAHVYPVRLGVQWPEGVRVTDVVTALDAALAGGRLRVAGRTHGPVAYHDPCDSTRAGRDPEAPRRLAVAACGQGVRELFWRAGRAHPCGATGALDLTHPELARDLAVARWRDAGAAGATTLMTDDPACLTHLRRHAPPGTNAISLYERLAEALA